MTDAIAPSTFDIADLFSGKIYPKDVKEVYLDEAVAYEITKNNKAIKDALVKEDTEKLVELEQKHQELVKRAASSKVTFYLTGVSREERRAVLDKTLEEFPQQFNMLGQPLPDQQANEAHANRKWALHTERIVRADGSAIIAPDEATIKVFRGNAPDLVVEEIENAILDLSEGVKGGFETLVQETDFLSQP